MSKEPIVGFSPAFKGSITVSDLLSSEGTHTFVFDTESVSSSGFLFQVDGFGFVFSLSFQNEAIVFKRNNTLLIETEFLKGKGRIRVFAMWSHSKLELDCRAGSEIKKADVQTQPTAAPTQLIKWARKNSLLPIETYKSEEEFRERVHSSLNTINHKIREADAYKSFWNIRYEGQKIVERKPKREVEVQPIIHCILSDQMLAGNIEVIPEQKTGEGNLDFLFLGQVDGLGICKFCAEFKLAHSDDLDHGLWDQLPKYMDVSNATYGAYCVLNYKCDWFDLPTFKDGKALDIYLDLIPPVSKKPVHSNIRNFIFNLGKPSTASKRS